MQDIDQELKRYGVKSKIQKEKVMKLLDSIWSKSHEYKIITDITLTPKMAEAWLETVTRNRSLHEKDVEDYEKYMLTGKWRSHNGTTMSFDWTGEFRDGQHRAWAVFNTGVSITIDVAVGVDPDVIRTVDTGRGRTAGDTLMMEEMAVTGQKLKHHEAIGQALKLILSHEKTSIYVKYRYSNDEIQDARLSHPDVIESAEFVCRKDNLIPKSKSIALHYLFSRVKTHKQMADAFWDTLITGIDLQAGSPVLALRRKLIAAKNDKGSALTHTFYLACTIRAWDAYKRGKSLSSVVFTPDSLPSITGKISGKIKKSK